MSIPAQAQMVVQAYSAQLQPQIGRDAEGYTTCGIRAVVLDMTPTLVDAYDFSINLYLGLVGMAKAGKAQTSIVRFLNGKKDIKPIRPSPVNFWIANESDGKALTPFKIIASESPGYILAGVDFIQASHKILAIAHGERMQFATRYKNQHIDTVVSFAGKLTEEEFNPLLACLAGLGERMSAELNSSETTKTK